MCEQSQRSCLRKSKLFFARRLDYPNQLDLAHEISFCAHAIGMAWSAVTVTPLRRFGRLGQISPRPNRRLQPAKSDNRDFRDHPGCRRLDVTEQHVKFFVQISGVAERIGNAVTKAVKIDSLVNLQADGAEVVIKE
jgi:hypothetical protein